MAKKGEIKNRVGEINYNKFGSKMEIINYRGVNDIDVYFEKYNWIYYHAEYHNFLRKNIYCPYDKRIYNAGYLGEGEYVFKINGKQTKCYDMWHNMLQRCYDEKYKNKKPTYKGCIVCEEWLNFQNFAKWYYNNYYEIEGEQMHLDKDILIKGNKIYSPQTCIIVPNRINVLFINRKNDRGNCPIGVTYHKRDNVYETKLSFLNKNGKQSRIYLGRYNTPEEAFQSYKQAKENYIKQVADEYKSYIPKELYDAMYRYEVEIDD